MTDHLPADRYIEAALSRIGSGCSLEDVKRDHARLGIFRPTIELARMIEKYEPFTEPVDPDVEIVKEAKASLCIGLQSSDPMPSAGAIALRAIKLAREKGSL